ncbi:hypothetical protein [Pseudomonas aeruginosa]|uniref:hypothetical protein n=4 Tax=Gammaproteobacteria TaxID=1236 RepID=UPI0020323147|nr:hypothetical protein [Pseudomonas aeruginosa]MCM2008867.1 hypothetical protein [Pseudomonas aeruginosa]
MPRSARLCRSLRSPVSLAPGSRFPGRAESARSSSHSNLGFPTRRRGSLHAVLFAGTTLADLGPLLDCLRRWPRIREPRPGVFYLGDQPFCQFHSRNGQRWADVKRRKGRLPPFVLPPGDQYSARAFQIFLLQAYKLN